MNLTWPVALAITAATLTACGGGGGASVKTLNGHPDPSALAQKFGCTSYHADSTGPMLYAATSGECTMKTEDDVEVDTFASSDSESHYRQAAEQIGGKTGTLIYGSRWLVQANDADQAAAIQKKVGGEVS